MLGNFFFKYNITHNRYSKKLKNRHISTMPINPFKYRHLKLCLSNKTANMHDKTVQFTTRCNGERVITLKWQISLW